LGLAAYRTNSADPGTQLSYQAWTTYPVWIRIRSCTNYNDSYNLYFDYSTDNITWTNQYAWAGAWNHSYSESCGMFVRNFDATRNAVWCDFDEFWMVRSFGPG
jgi:L,D-peptidoglycan transpeptidase YkuD (ErfK/YbiS/YcfS/YnhG family)